MASISRVRVRDGMGEFSISSRIRIRSGMGWEGDPSVVVYVRVRGGMGGWGRSHLVFIRNRRVLHIQNRAVLSSLSFENKLEPISISVFLIADNLA